MPRPKPDQPKTQVSLRITESQKKRLDLISAARGSEKGQVIGEAIDKLWERERAEVIKQSHAA
jgi:predicted DNA-binding protein